MSASVAEKLRQRSIEIVISHDQKDVVDQGQLALLAAGGIHVRGRVLVHVVYDASTVPWLAGSAGVPIIARLGRERIRELAGAAATWIKLDKEGKATRSMVPSWFAPTLQERGQWPFPPLDGVSDAPVLRVDGTIHSTPGYDLATRTIFEPSGAQWPALKLSPSYADAATAIEELSEPFRDFRFVGSSDKSAAIALVLSIVGRRAIAGCVPMFAVGATVPGAGKGLLADVATIIGTGQPVPKMAPARGDDEMRKRLLAIGIAAPSAVCIDNIAGGLGSEALESALTAGVIQDRILGVSEDRSVPITTVFIATGNNLMWLGDLGRRVVPIDLDPKCEHPEDRRDFRHPNLLEYVRASRPRLVTAALTLLRAYRLAGSPSHGQPAKGSYESWDALVRGAILWVKGGDPLAGVKRIRDRGDSEIDKLRALTGAWHARLSDHEVTIAELLETAATDPNLRAALDAYGSKGQPITAQLLGTRLGKVRGRIVGGRAIEDAGMGHAGARRWKVVTL